MGWIATVDGSEIQRSAVEVVSLSHYLQVLVLYPRWFSRRISEPSTESPHKSSRALFPSSWQWKTRHWKMIFVSNMVILSYSSSMILGERITTYSFSQDKKKKHSMKHLAGASLFWVPQNKHLGFFYPQITTPNKKRTSWWFQSI